MSYIFKSAAIGALSFFIYSCANNRAPKSEPKAFSSCAEKNLESSHFSIATQAKAHKFSGCFANYLKLNKLNEFKVQTCNQLVVRSDGSVAQVSVTGDETPIPNDLKWCLEQEFWKMDYSKLQFERTLKIKFSSKFEVRK